MRLSQRPKGFNNPQGFWGSEPEYDVIDMQVDPASIEDYCQDAGLTGVYLLGNPAEKHLNKGVTNEIL